MQVRNSIDLSLSSHIFVRINYVENSDVKAVHDSGVVKNTVFKLNNDCKSL